MMIDEVKLAFSENKKEIYVSIAILLISLILGYFLEPYLYDYFNPIVDNLTQKVQSGVIKVTFDVIFLNNLRVIFQMFLFGLLFCFSAVILAFNGFFAGYYVGTSDDLLQVLLLILPHGIFEFSSCILACASGFVLFKWLYNFLKIFLNLEDSSIMEMLFMSFKSSFVKLKQAFILLAISVFLMIIAGLIEAYLTLPIAQAIFSILS